MALAREIDPTPPFLPGRKTTGVAPHRYGIYRFSGQSSRNPALLRK